MHDQTSSRINNIHLRCYHFEPSYLLFMGMLVAIKHKDPFTDCKKENGNIVVIMSIKVRAHDESLILFCIISDVIHNDLSALISHLAESGTDDVASYQAKLNYTTRVKTF